jgi:hypothetical protein
VKPASPTYSPIHPDARAWINRLQRSWSRARLAEGKPLELVAERAEHLGRAFEQAFLDGTFPAGPEQTVVTRAMDAGATYEEALYGEEE